MEAQLWARVRSPLQRKLFRVIDLTVAPFRNSQKSKVNNLIELLNPCWLKFLRIVTSNYLSYLFTFCVLTSRLNGYLACWIVTKKKPEMLNTVTENVFSFSLRRSNLIIHQDFKIKNPRNFRKTAKNRLLFCKRPAATILTKEYFRCQGISADCCPRNFHVLKRNICPGSEASRPNM